MKKHLKTSKWSYDVKFAPGQDFSVILLRRDTPDGTTDKWKIKIDTEDLPIIRDKTLRLDPHNALAFWEPNEENIQCIQLIHRLVMDAKEGQYVRNISHDLFDLRKSNLSICDNFSCVAQNSIRKSYNIFTCNGRNDKYYYLVKIHNGRRICFAQFNSLVDARRAKIQWRKREAKEEINWFKVISDYQINDGQPGHHIWKTGLRYRVYYRGKYIGLYSDFNVAVRVRDKAIKAHVKELLK